MSPIALDVQIQGDERVKLMFNGVVRRGYRMRQFGGFLAQDFREIMRRQFDSGGRYLGAPWTGLADSTIERKEREGADSRILHEFRFMRKSFTQGRGGYRYESRGYFKLGSDIPYVGYHQTGTSRMPQRIVFQFTPWLSRRWRVALGRYLVEGENPLNMIGHSLRSRATG